VKYKFDSNLRGYESCTSEVINIEAGMLIDEIFANNYLNQLYSSMKLSQHSIVRIFWVGQQFCDDLLSHDAKNFQSLL
jgi:hypothetical protein